MCKMHYHSIPMPEFILTIYLGKIKYKLEMLVKRLNGLSGYLNFISHKQNLI